MTVPAAVLLDLGHTIVPRGTPVRVARAPRPTLPNEQDPSFTGTLQSVDLCDGIPHTAGIWDGTRIRHVYISRVTVSST